MAPAGALARSDQPGLPKPVEFELTVEMTDQPARPPLPRPMQRHPIEPDLNALAHGMRRHLAIGGKQGQLRRPLGRLVERLDGPAPQRPLAIVDLPQVEHLPLHHLAAGTAPALDNVPIEMILAVFVPSVPLQVHVADSTLYPAVSQRLGLDYSQFWSRTP